MKTLITDFYGWKLLEYTWLLFATLFVLALSIALKSDALSTISAISNVLCVILVAKGRISNYLWGAIGVTLYGYLSFSEHYYGNMLLNWGYYLPLQFVGIYLWHKHMNKASVEKKTLSALKRILVTLFLIVTVYLLAYELAKHQDPMPYADAYTTLASIIAMYLMIWRYAEQWLLWVSSDLVSLYMWLIPTLHHVPNAAATLAMWVIFTINALYGLYLWFNPNNLRN